MKICSVLTLTIIVLGLNIAGYGQAGTTYSPSLDLYVNQDTGGLWRSRSASQMDSMISNQLNSLMAERMELGRMEYSFAATEQIGKKLDGQRKIGRGQATTKFVSSPPNSLVERMAAKAKTPQEEQQLRESFSIALATFNNILKAKGMNPGDTADSNALAFVLSYIVYKGEDPGDARLRKFSSFQRKVYLADAVYQGTPAEEKQKTYESRAFRAMVAVRASQAAGRANISGREKQNAEATAKEYAAGVLKDLWSGVAPERMALSSTTEWGFDDIGSKIIESGKATVAFTRSNRILSGTALAGEFGINERQVKSLINEFDAEINRRGGQTNDVAWMNALSFAICYKIYTDGRVDLNQAQFNWVVDEMRKDVMSKGDYQSLTNEEKQEYYERWAVVGMLLQEQGRNPETRSNAKREAQERVGLLLKDGVESYTLMPTGFVKKR